MRVSTLHSIDTSDWNEVVILFPDGHTFEHKTLCSREEMEAFCDKFGYCLWAFRPGTNPLCN